jgi:hypothetical protein
VKNALKTSLIIIKENDKKKPGALFLSLPRQMSNLI